MAECGYLMESEAEAIRLDVKTDLQPEKQALWAAQTKAELAAMAGHASLSLGVKRSGGAESSRYTPQQSG